MKICKLWFRGASWKNVKYLWRISILHQPRKLTKYNVQPNRNFEFDGYWKKCLRIVVERWIEEMILTLAGQSQPLSFMYVHLKNIRYLHWTGFEPMTSAIPVQRSNQHSDEATQTWARQFVRLICSLLTSEWLYSSVGKSTAPSSQRSHILSYYSFIQRGWAIVTKRNDKKAVKRLMSTE